MDKRYEFKGTGLTEAQIETGKLKFQEYLTSYPHLNTLGNSQLLEELVWVEAVLEENKEKAGVILNKKIAPGSSCSSSADLVPKGLKEAIEEGRTQVLNLKAKCGMFTEQKDRDAYQTIQDLMTKAEAYRKANPLSFKVTCPFCAKSFALMRRTEHFDEFKSPFLEDKILNNKPLMTLYHAGVLTKEQVAEILGVYVKYVDWLDNKVYGRTHVADTEIKESAPTHTDDPKPE